jgi:ABC-type lipoprotein release transport system permease subunit
MKHILKMIWNQRRSYYGVFLEQVLVTLILMLSVVSVFEAYKKYNMPGMLNVENTYYAGQMFENGVPWSEIENMYRTMNVIIENIKNLPYVKAVTRGVNFAPYMREPESYARASQNQSPFDSIRIDDKRFVAIFKVSDEFGASVLNVEIEEGKWVENRILEDGSLPIVITRQFADKAGWSTATGKKIPLGPNYLTVVGVIAGLKELPFVPSPAAMVGPTFATNGQNFENLVRIEPGNEMEFVEAYNREFRRLIPSDKVEPQIYYMPSVKRMWVSQSILPIVLQAIPTLFLFIFAFIGTFGLYWMASQKRMKEFALRIALGSTRNRLMRLVIGESLLITCFAILPTLSLSFFIYEYTAVHAIAISAVVFVMLLFAVVSAWYPAWKVMHVNPVEALQYE